MMHARSVRRRDGAHVITWGAVAVVAACIARNGRARALRDRLAEHFAGYLAS